MSFSRRILILDLSAHFFVTLSLTALVYITTANFQYALAVIAGGIFIDLDHLVDYFICFGASFDLKKFFQGAAVESGKVYLFLHSWELILILLCLSLVLNSGLLLALFLGMSAHLLIDNFQRKNLLAYIFIYRAWNKFKINIVMPEHISRLRVPAC